MSYEVCGLRMRSEIPLPAPQSSTDEADVTITVGARLAIPWERPSTDVVAELVGSDGWPRYSFCHEDNGEIRARFYGLADFAISADGGSVVCHTHPEVDEGLSAILIAGSVAAYLLSSAGQCVLHASAVEVEPGSAVAFVGPTTRGKTTTAALLCARGFPLVTDDVLAVVLGDGPPRCQVGANELRLRPAQLELLSQFVAPPFTRSTADDRLAVRPAAPRSRESLLKGVVVPWPTREEKQVSVRKLPLAEAVQLLVTTTRIEGWRSPERVAKVFDQAVEIAGRVPLLEATIPWGPPFASTVADDLLEHITAILG